jgi:mannose-6-phosphate isomerase
MPSPPTPFRLLPAFHHRPWGLRSLAPWFADEFDAPVGEAWFTAAGSGTSLGPSLGELLASDGPRLLGTSGFPGNQPLLLKLLFTAERLSVQVHPDDEYGWRHHRSPGKTEAWHVLAAEPTASVGLGFVRPLTAETARAAARSGEIERLLAWVPARPGSTFFVPAGTVHAIGAGLTLVEVQQPSDVTYRLYDYGRPRELHLDHGFAVADLGPYQEANERVLVDTGRHVLARCHYFTTERLEVRRIRRFLGVEPFYHLLVVLEGAGAVAGQSARGGDVFFVAARCDDFEMTADSMDVLVAYTSASLTRAFGGHEA